MIDLVRPDKGLGYSSIYLDFLNSREKVGKLYRADNPAGVADQLDTLSYDRSKMVDLLRRQNQAFGSSEKSMALIEQLADERAVCLFSGQQACLFGGPMLVILKALAVAKAGAVYSEQLKRPVVPIFWIAGDDHDFEEVNHTSVIDRHGDIAELQYRTLPEVELPTAEIKWSDEDELARIKTQLAEILGETDFTQDIYELIEKTYTSADTCVTSFAKLIASLTSEIGLVLFSPGDSDVKHLAAPFFRAVIEKGEPLHQLLAETKQDMLDAGYHIQVEKKPNATHLFCNLDGRKPVMADGDAYVVGERRFSKNELLALIDSEPERFSPDVMTRPVLQSYLFPVVSQKGGPSEIAYLAQIAGVFELFDLVTPYYKARPTATFVETRFEKLLDQHDIEFEELTGDIEQVINRVLAASFPEDLETKFDQLRRHVECHFEDFMTDSLKFDPALKGFAKQSLGKIDFTLKNFEGKVFSSHKKRSGDTRSRIYRLYHTLYPNRGFQERTVNVTYFLARYGREFIKFVYDKLDPEESAHQLIYLSEGEL